MHQNGSLCPHTHRRWPTAGRHVAASLFSESRVVGVPSGSDFYDKLWNRDTEIACHPILARADYFVRLHQKYRGIRRYSTSCKAKPIDYFAPREGCRMFKSACLYVCLFTHLKNHMPKFSTHDAGGRGSVLWRQCSRLYMLQMLTLRTPGFVNYRPTDLSIIPLCRECTLPPGTLNYSLFWLWY